MCFMDFHCTPAQQSSFPGCWVPLTSSLLARRLLMSLTKSLFLFSHTIPFLKVRRSELNLTPKVQEHWVLASGMDVFFFSSPIMSNNICLWLKSAISENFLQDFSWIPITSSELTAVSLQQCIFQPASITLHSWYATVIAVTSFHTCLLNFLAALCSLLHLQVSRAVRYLWKSFITYIIYIWEGTDPMESPLSVREFAYYCLPFFPICNNSREDLSFDSYNNWQKPNLLSKQRENALLRTFQKISCEELSAHCQKSQIWGSFCTTIDWIV